MKTQGRKKASGTSPAIDEQAVRELIARKAYERFEKRGKVAGHDSEDWIEAEREVLAEMKNQLDAKVKVLRPRSGAGRKRPTSPPG